MSNALHLQTEVIEQVDGEISWPKDLPKDAYTLSYLHSELKLTKAQPTLIANVLYEAWAFDGNKSWHIWNQDGTWVCTTYDARDVDDDLVVEREQLLMNQFKNTTKKDTLVLHHRLDFDTDGQAYIVYSCPINLIRKEN